MTTTPGMHLKNLREALGVQGWTLLEDEWRGTRSKYRIACPSGHTRETLPGNVRGSRPMVCANCQQDELWLEFKLAVEAKGGTLVEAAWIGSDKLHAVKCPEGHDTSVQPQALRAGQGICRTCGYASRSHARPEKSYAAEASFRARIEGKGGVVLEETWLGNQKPHRVRCPEGHECAPRPNNVANGAGMCVTCSWSSQDSVYVVAGASMVKLGITTDDPAIRLKAHGRDGLNVELRCWLGLPPGVAHRVEQKALKTLHAEGVRPVKGREYFEDRYASLIVDVLASLLHKYL